MLAGSSWAYQQHRGKKQARAAAHHVIQSVSCEVTGTCVPVQVLAPLLGNYMLLRRFNLKKKKKVLIKKKSGKILIFAKP